METLKNPFESPKGEQRFRREKSREGFGMISVALAMLALLCLGYVWAQVKYPPAGRYYGQELIYFVIASLFFNILGIGSAIIAERRTIGIISNVLVLAWNVAIFFFGVVP